MKFLVDNSSAIVLESSKCCMNIIKIVTFILTLLLNLIPIQAQAYIGPGIGLGLAATVMGLFLAFILLLVGLIWLPLRRILRKRKEKQE